MRIGEEAGGQSSISLIGFPILGAPCCYTNSSRLWIRKKPKDFVPGVRSFEWPSVVQQIQKGNSRYKRSEGYIEVADTLEPFNEAQSDQKGFAIVKEKHISNSERIPLLHCISPEYKSFGGESNLL
jgi:hypothetical protein